jgi:hypothetical protein
MQQGDNYEGDSSNQVSSVNKYKTRELQDQEEKSPPLLPGVSYGMKSANLKAVP